MSDEIVNIERDIADFEKKRAECLANIRALRDEEDLVKGIFRHAEIHAAQQEKLRLDFEIQYRKNRIKRMRFGG